MRKLAAKLQILTKRPPNWAYLVIVPAVLIALAWQTTPGSHVPASQAATPSNASTRPSAAVGAAGVIGRAPMTGVPQPPEIPVVDGFNLTQLHTLLRKHKVKSAQIDEGQETIKVTLKSGAVGQTSYLDAEASRLTAELEAAGVPYTVHSRAAGSAGAAVLNTILPILLLGGLFGFAFWWQKKQQGQHGQQFLRGKGRSNKVVSVPNVRWSDVAGADEAVEEMKEAIEFLKRPDPFKRLGAKMPKGILLYGPPGTGKTLLAKAAAGESGVPFFEASGSEFVEMFVGVGAARIRDLLRQARESKGGAVVFMDEIDAIGRKRSAGAQHDGERDQTLNQLLTEMDGFRPDDKILFIAATNRKDTLDDALTRPGRFGKHIQIGLPGEKGRLKILQVHAKGKPFAKEASLEGLAARTAGMSGAQLADVINEAALQAARNDHKEITESDLREGHLRALAGPKKRDQRLSEDELRSVSYHEAGHVLAAELCPTQDKAQHTTVEERGEALGLAFYGQTDRVLHDAELIHETMIVALGGRAAEQIVFGKVSTGAANDLLKVNEIARRAVEEFGLSPKLGQIVGSSGGRQVSDLSQATRKVIDEEVEKMVADAYRDALAILTANRAKLDRLALMLIEHKNLERVDILVALGEDEHVPVETGHAIGPRQPQAVHVEEEPGEAAAALPIAATVAHGEDPGLLEQLAGLIADRRRRRRERSGRKRVAGAA